jgi:hypothetical protein
MYGNGAQIGIKAILVAQVYLTLQALNVLCAAARGAALPRPAVLLIVTSTRPTTVSTT